MLHSVWSSESDTPPVRVLKIPSVKRLLSTMSYLLNRQLYLSELKTWQNASYMIFVMSLLSN
jgi:hypothetical protein